MSRIDDRELIPVFVSERSEVILVRYRKYAENMPESVSNASNRGVGIACIRSFEANLTRGYENDLLIHAYSLTNHFPSKIRLFLYEVCIRTASIHQFFMGAVFDYFALIDHD